MDNSSQSQAGIAILEALPEASALIDDRNVLVGANSAFLSMFGLDRFSVIGAPFFQISESIFDRTHLERLIYACRDCGELCQALVPEDCEREPEGRYFEIAVSSVEPGLLLIRMPDITPYLLSENSLKRSNKQLSIVNEIIYSTTASPDLADMLNRCVEKTVELLDFDVGAICLLDEAKSQVEMKAFYGKYDLPAPEITTMTLSNPMHREVLEGCKPQYFEQYFDVSHEDGELGVLSFAHVPIISDSGVIGSINIGSSKTHRFPGLEKETLESIGRQTGAAISRGILQEKLQDANIRSNLYLDIMEHDIRNANTTVKGYAEMLVKISEGLSREYSLKLMTGVRQSEEIIQNISTMRKIHEEGGALHLIDLDMVIRNEILQHEGISITYHDTGCYILADKLLPLVFVNLIGNSEKFGGIGVEITIQAEEKGDFIDVSVSDTGPGIPPDLLPYIFDRFRRGTMKKDGKGLGLHIVRMLVHRYGGTVSAVNNDPDSPASGCTMHFTLQKVDRI